LAAHHQLKGFFMAVGIINPAVAHRAWLKMQSQLCVISGHENSNGFYGGFGYSYGWHTALPVAKIKQYAAPPATLDSSDNSTNAANNASAYPAATATPLSGRTIPQTTSGGWHDAANKLDATTYSGLWQQYFSGRAHATSGATYSNHFRPLSWLGTTLMSESSRTGGLEFATDGSTASHFNRKAQLTADFWATSDNEFGGSYRPRIIEGSVPNVAVAWQSGDATVTIADGSFDPTVMSRSTRVVAAGTRDQKFRIQWAGPTTTYRPGGECWLGYQLVFETQARAGAFYSPFWAVGGCSTEDFAYTTTRTDGSQVAPEALQHWFEVVSRPAVAAGQQPFLIWMIGDTSNSASETNTSVLTGKTGNSSAAYVENCSALIDFITTAWTDTGKPAHNLVFCLRGDHPALNTTNEPIQQRLRTEAFSQLAARYSSRVFGFKQHELITPAQLSAGSYYADVDGYHLNQAGYEALCTRLVRAWANVSAPRRITNRGRPLLTVR